MAIPSVVATVRTTKPARRRNSRSTDPVSIVHPLPDAAKRLRGRRRLQSLLDHGREPNDNNEPAGMAPCLREVATFGGRDLVDSAGSGRKLHGPLAPVATANDSNAPPPQAVATATLRMWTVSSQIVFRLISE